MKTAVVIGGTHDHIHLLDELKHRDYSTVLVDYLEHPPAKDKADVHVRESALDREKVLAVAREYEASLALAFCIDQAVPTMAYVSERLGLPCYVSYQKALSLTNKVKMKTIMKSADIPTARFIVTDKTGAGDVLKSGLTCPLVVKPADSNSSKGVTMVTAANEIESAVDRAHSCSRTGEIIVEEYKEGIEYSADFFIRDHQPTLLLTTRYYKSKVHSRQFLINQSVYPSGLSRRIEADLVTLARKISYAFGLSDGPLFLQFLVDGEDIYIIEFSARIGGGSKHHFLRYVMGLDYVSFLVDFVLGCKAPLLITPREGCCAMYFVYARRGVMTACQAFEELKLSGVISDYFLYKSLGGVISGAMSSTDRPLGFMIEGESFAELDHKIELIDNQVTILDEQGQDMMLHQSFSRLSPG